LDYSYDNEFNCETNFQKVIFLCFRLIIPNLPTNTNHQTAATRIAALAMPEPELTSPRKATIKSAPKEIERMIRSILIPFVILKKRSRLSPLSVSCQGERPLLKKFVAIACTSLYP
jgi:hypothetical protein